MNAINRLKETWTPSWDFGLQAEMDFLCKGKEADEDTQTVDSGRPNPWTMASREALNRQTAMDRRVACDTSSLADILLFFESLSEEVGSNE